MSQSETTESTQTKMDSITDCTQQIIATLMDNDYPCTAVEIINDCSPQKTIIKVTMKMDERPRRVRFPRPFKKDPLPARDITHSIVVGIINSVLINRGKNVNFEVWIEAVACR